MFFGYKNVKTSKSVKLSKKCGNDVESENMFKPIAKHNENGGLRDRDTNNLRKSVKREKIRKVKNTKT